MRCESLEVMHIRRAQQFHAPSNHPRHDRSRWSECRYGRSGKEKSSDGTKGSHGGDDVVLVELGSKDVCLGLSNY